MTSLVGCAGDNPQPTAEPAVIEILRSIDSIFINEAVDFLLADIETSEPVERASWGIASHHNVPGDRGVMRSDGRYTAPRLIPDSQTVHIWAKSGGQQIFTEFEVRDSARPDPEATARPGDLNPVFSVKEIKTSRPIDSGLRVGQSWASPRSMGLAALCWVDHYEIVHNNRVVDYAGAVTCDGVYTVPSAVTVPPLVRIHIIYLREGARPGQVSLIGPAIEIAP